MESLQVCRSWGSTQGLVSLSNNGSSSRCRLTTASRPIVTSESSRTLAAGRPGGRREQLLALDSPHSVHRARGRCRAADGADTPGPQAKEQAQAQAQAQAQGEGEGEGEGEAFTRALETKKAEDILDRIASGEFTVASKRVDRLGGLRRLLARSFGGPGRAVASVLAAVERRLRVLAREKIPEARGDVRAIIGKPFFVPLFTLYTVYGGVFRLSFGPRQFVIVSDPAVAKHILKDNAKSYSKGILSEILDFVMGNGLIPADGELWRVRRRAIVPALHRKFVEEMITLFSDASLRLCDKLALEARGEGDGKAADGTPLPPGVVEMESLFSRVTLDVIGKAVFNYEFDSVSKDTGIVEAVYVTLREAEARSTALFPYWKIPPLRALVPQQRRVEAALRLVNRTLDELIDTCRRISQQEDEEFYEEYVNKRDPSILRFLIASGDDVSTKQLRDDLMTMLIAGHETSAAVLTWTFYLLVQNPEKMRKLQAEADSVLGDRAPALEDVRSLRYATRVISEAMRLYPQPPVLIRRALEDDMLGGYPIRKGQDIFISVWNLHHSPELWPRAEDFWPERWGSLEGPDPNETTEGFRYLPFGGGQRKCVGDVFATYEVVICLALLARRFDFALAPGVEEVGMTTGATIHTTNGMLMTVTPRQGRGTGAVKGTSQEVASV